MRNYKSEYYALVSEILGYLNKLSDEQEINIFDPTTIEGEDWDKIFDYPYAYYVDKYEYYNEGRIYRVYKGECMIMLTGEQSGTITLSLQEIPLESILDILDYIKE